MTDQPTVINGVPVIENCQGRNKEDARVTAYRELANFAANVKPYCVYGYNAGLEDGKELADDIRVFAQKVDAVMKAYGLYARDQFGSWRVDMRVFDTPLSDAIDGNATFVLEAAGEEADDDHMTYAAEDAADRRWDSRFS